MKKKTTEEKVVNVLFLCALIFQYSIIFYNNFFHADRMIDYDSGLAIRHAVDMWRNRTIFLEGFHYTTSMEIDCAAFFAAPIYILSGNIGLAIGIVHAIFDSILGIGIYQLMKNLNAGFNFRIFAIILVFTPYAYGQISWDNMLFLSVGQYEFRVITTILMLVILTYNQSQETYERKRSYYVQCAACEFFLFISVLSTGMYLIMIVLIPVLLAKVISIFLEQKIVWKDRNLRFLLLSSLIAWMAFSLNKIKQVELYRTNLNLNTTTEIVDSFFNMFIGMFSLFGGITGKQVEVLSWDGICIMARFAFVFIIVVMVIIGIKNRKKALLNEQFVLDVQLIVFLNLCVFVLANTRYGSPVFEDRYHIIWMTVVILFDVAWLASWWKSEKNDWLKSGICIALTVGLFIINLSGMNRMLNVSDSKLLVNNECLQKADELGVDNILVYEDYATTNMLSALDIDKNVRCIKYDENGNLVIETWGTFYEPNINPHHMLMVKSEQCGILPVEFLEKYIEKGSIGKWTMYLSKL